MLLVVHGFPSGRLFRIGVPIVCCFGAFYRRDSKKAMVARPCFRWLLGFHVFASEDSLGANDIMQNVGV